MLWIISNKGSICSSAYTQLVILFGAKLIEEKPTVWAKSYFFNEATFSPQKL
jgi:hypothetical protein